MDENTKTCANCGCCEEELFEVNGELYCRDCLKSMGYIQCSDCGEWTPEDCCYVTNDGDIICEDCYNDHYFTCEDCGEIFHNDFIVCVNSETRYERYVCEDCAGDYYVCDDCGGYFSSRYVYTDNYDHCLCDTCYDTHDYVTCDRCGEILRADNAYFYDGTPYCESCYDDVVAEAEEEDDNDGGRNFHDYGFKPTPQFGYRKGEEADTELTFGIEDEVDNGNDRMALCDALTELGQPIYMKYDGSLGSRGVEIVSHPGTLAYHLYEMRWANICRTCIQHDYRSHDTRTCGLHIHVGRKQMGKDGAERHAVAGRLVLLANRLKDELTKFSRRKPEQLAQWAPFPPMDIYPLYSDRTLENIGLGTSTEGWHSERYRAVNLTNESTVEFRIFKGTLKRDTIAASLQLVSNLVKYAMAHTAHECAFEASFADILAVAQYKELNTYCATRGLL